MTAYLKKEQSEITGKHDVQAYRDPDLREKLARWTSHYSNKPTKRNKRVVINCATWRVVWA